MARHYGITTSRLYQILSILKLCPEVLEVVAELGDPLPSPLVTEHRLRTLVNSPIDEQRRWAQELKSRMLKQTGE